MLHRLLVACALALGIVALPALAQTAPPDPARQLIEKQLDAFAHDDAVAAYALAAPRIKAIFPDPNIFMAMVATGYPALYRHRSVEFGPADVKDDTIGQGVTFTDSDGRVWTALYELEKQSDGQWAIAGCVMAKSTDKAL